MKYKAVFIDVDGTLLMDDLSISAGTKEVLARLSSNNILISIVTARPPGASLCFYDQLGIVKNPIICFNGALILQENNILKEESVNSFYAQRILGEVEGFNVNTSFYRHHEWYTENIDTWIKNEAKITGSIATRIDFKQLMKTNFEPNKILFMGEPTEIELLEKHFKSLRFTDLNIHKSKPTYLEIVNGKASKSSGIENLIDLFGIDSSEIIAIGDNYNDVDMLKFAGTSVAMGNAPEDVKTFATIVTDTNNKDGIQKALNLLIP